MSPPFAVALSIIIIIFFTTPGAFLVGRLYGWLAVRLCCRVAQADGTGESGGFGMQTDLEIVQIIEKRPSNSRKSGTLKNRIGN